MNDEITRLARIQFDANPDALKIILSSGAANFTSPAIHSREYVEYGKSKKRMYPIMIDVFHKVINYRNAREKSGVEGWHAVEPAPDDAEVWRQKSATVGGNRCERVQRVGKGPAGYIGKNGFNQHT